MPSVVDGSLGARVAMTTNIVPAAEAQQLDTVFDIWIFLTIWISVYFAFVYLICGFLVAARVVGFWHAWFWAPLGAALLGGLNGFLAGSIPSVIIAGMYEVGGFYLTEEHGHLWAGGMAAFLMYNSLGRKYYSGGKHLNEIEEMHSKSDAQTPRHTTSNKKFEFDTSDAF